jgi:Protein of unknown function (DUF3606)
MADDKTKTGWQDDTKINIHQPYEVHYWANKFGVSQEALKRAVGKVGPSVKAVQRELGK